jgi:SWI/SNF-related matrix-associated actin-dependent regulator 1 of chromatin subfamily A
LLDQEFGGFWPFANRYCAPKRDDFGLRFGAANLDELANRLRSRCYCRREKSMVLPQLPGKSRTDVWIDLEQRHEYERVELKNRERLRALATRDHEDASASAEHAARAEARRRSQLGCIQNILHECGRQKVAGIVHWIRSFVVREEPLVVFAHHRDVIATLKAHFPHALCITGADKPAQRDRAAQAFQAGESTLVICSTQVAGIGITLTRAAHVAFAEIGWSAAAHDQAEDRIHRIGQNRAATVWYLLAEDTIDSLILDVIERKRSMAGQLNASALLELGNALVQMTGGSRRGQPGSKADEHAV